MINMRDFQSWKEMRNILSHRSTLGRRIYMGGGPNEVVWGEKILVDEDTTVSRRRWLVKMLHGLLDAADVFTAAKLVWP